MTDESDEIVALLKAGVGGNPEAMSDLWERYRPRLERLVRLRLDSRVQRRIDPADVLQDVFIDFAMRAADYLNEPQMPFYLWLRLLTGQRLLLLHRHHLGTQMRDAGREVTLCRGGMPNATSIHLAAQLLGRFTSVSHAVQRAEMQAILQNVINELEPMDREILALRHFEELSNAETALVLSIDPSAASSRHVRALKRLRQALEGRPGFFNQRG